MYRKGYENSLEKIRKHSDRVDKYQIIDGSSIGNDEPHTQLETKPLEVARFAFKIIEAVRLEHLV